MPLESEIQDFISRSERFFGPNAMNAPLSCQRGMYQDLCQAFARPRPTGLEVTEDTVTTADMVIPIRRYRLPDPTPQAGILFLHGGGFVFGNLDSHDDVAAELALTTGATVIAVDYRLAPEHPFPAALEDAYTVFCWLQDSACSLNIDPHKLAVCGDSAGGNLAAALTLLTRDRCGPTLGSQVLIYPALGIDTSLPSYQENAHAPLLTRAEMKYYWNAYLNGATANTYAAPLLAENLSGLPPAFILTVEYDPLRDDGELYAQRLQSSGIHTQHYQAPGLVHGFLRARHTSPGSQAAFAAACDFLKRMLR